MSTTYGVNDYTYINQRVKELEEERQKSQKPVEEKPVEPPKQEPGIYEDYYC